MSNDIVFV